MNKTALFLVLIVLAGCQKPFYDVANQSSQYHKKLSDVTDHKIMYEVMLIGDSGAPETEEPDPILRMMDERLQKMGDNSAVVFLGDNIYPAGLPDTSKTKYKRAKDRLNVQLYALQYFKGDIFFIPGNHDWNDGKKGGWERLKNQEQYIEQKLDAGNVFIPDNGTPGPVVNPLTDSLVLVALDTQWWLQEFKKPTGLSRQQVIDSLAAVMDMYKDKQILLVGHHPLYSNGTHGGKLPPSTHLKPPVFGSLYVLYRKWFGLDQDIAYKPYTVMQQKITGILRQYQNIVYASGHDHNLQYITKKSGQNRQHYLVSGSASKQRYVKKGGQAEFVSNMRGFMVLTYYQSGSVELEVRVNSPEGEKVIYNTLVFTNE